MDLDDATTEALERLINDDLEHAEVMSASAGVLEDGRVVVDELTLRLEDGRIVGLDVILLATEKVAGPTMVLETYVERDPVRPAVKEGWRRMDVMTDFRQELADALTVLNPAADADRPENRL